MTPTLVLEEPDTECLLTGPEGNSVTLYRIKPGEACVLTNAALLAEVNYIAFAVAETQVTVQVLGSEAVRVVRARSAAFQSRFFRDQGASSYNCSTHSAERLSKALTCDSSTSSIP